MSVSGVTLTCTIGPILDALDRAGGSVVRVFRQADVSPRLIENPNRLILLKDQFALMEAMAREIGDAAVGARLSVTAGIDGLGPYGYLLASQPSLREALRVAVTMLSSALQTATRVSLRIDGRFAHWTYEVDDGAVVGRRQNELLCLGYVLAVLRHFGGPAWVPHRITVVGSPVDARSTIETLYGGRIEVGRVTAVTFPAEMLDCPNPAPVTPRSFRPLPDGRETPTSVAFAIASGLGDNRPDLVRTARRLGLTPRTLQRRLQEHGTSFERLLDRTLVDHAMAMMEEPLSLTAIAYELGFSDPSHFTRAFRRWAGMSPTEWRRSQAAVPATIP